MPPLPEPPLISGTTRRAMTPTELIVVIVVLLLIIYLLMPGLSGPPRRSPTTLCLCRMAQLVKAMLIYTEDYDDRLPFILKDAYRDDPMVGQGANRCKETWLAAGPTMQRIYLLPEEDWYASGDPCVIRSGTLFPYTRFESLYRCPEFEKIRDDNKRQGTFNYTRTLAARRADLERPGRFDGDVLKVNEVYAPASLPMLLDEAWDCYVAWPEPYKGSWSGIDCVWDVMGNCLGQNHGVPTAASITRRKSDGAWESFAWYPNSRPAGSEGGVVNAALVKRGGVACYDGHSELRRDPLPNMEHDGGRPPLYPCYSYTKPFFDWFAKLIYAQQGKTPEYPF
ncbi:MAG: hypothetical protein JXQ73_23610 [Phycisphaerae bacterium]|nr:hypothetical protein [Phycisphaerae bacterium]